MIKLTSLIFLVDSTDRFQEMWPTSNKMCALGASAGQINVLGRVTERLMFQAQFMTRYRETSCQLDDKHLKKYKIIERLPSKITPMYR